MRESSIRLNPSWFSRHLVRVCEQEFEIDAVKADEMFGPGMIIQDIVQEMSRAQVIIADISQHPLPSNPAILVYNPNVFFEVGYSFARAKPTILMARKNDEKLPFDISGSRVLFYEDSIGGKSRVEEQLRKHLMAITGKSPVIKKQ